MKEKFIIEQLKEIRKQLKKHNDKCQEKDLINYLKQNCMGYDNREKAQKLMNIIGVKDHKTFRNIIEKIRQDKRKEFICSEAGKNGGYWIPINEEEIQKTIDHLEARAYEMFKTAKNLREKKERSEKK